MLRRAQMLDSFCWQVAEVFLNGYNYNNNNNNNNCTANGFLFSVSPISKTQDVKITGRRKLYMLQYNCENTSRK